MVCNKLYKLRVIYDFQLQELLIDISGYNEI